MALLFLKGVRMGSPMSALAITLPEKMTSMDESHSDRGCFREKVNPAAKHTLIVTRIQTAEISPCYSRHLLPF